MSFSRRPAPCTHVSGHSLIEVTIAVGVLAIVTGIGLPSLGEALARQSIATAAIGWRDALAIARSHAIFRQVPAVLCPTVDQEACRQSESWERGYLLFEDQNRNRIREPTERVIRVFGAHPRLRMTTSAGRRTIAFQPTGRTDGSNATMTICDPTRPTVEGRRLITSNSGRTRSERSDCSE